MILASNHVSYLDPFVLGALADRRHRRVRFLAKRELFDRRATGTVLRAAHQIPVTRDSVDASGSLDAAVAALTAGECVCVFPEGTISLDLEPMPGKTGTARLAAASGVPVTPVGLWGAQRILFKGRKPRWRWGIAEIGGGRRPAARRPDRGRPRRDGADHGRDRRLRRSRSRHLPPTAPTRGGRLVGARPRHRPRAGPHRPDTVTDPRTRVAVIGAGSWGTAVAALLAPHADVTLWAREPTLADCLDTRHENARYLPGVALPESLRATTDLEDACRDADVVVLGVPSHGLRGVLDGARGLIAADTPIVSLAKGVEQGTHLRMTQVVADVLADHRLDRIGVLTGPNLAREVAAGQPAASVIAIQDPAAAASLQTLFMTTTFRVYTNPDVVGCEIAGALKNVFAIAAGIADGLGYGDNTKATLITRGLAELARLGVALGGDPLTFSGLAGMGDLVATCTSPQSRNRHVGVELGRGRSLDDIVTEMNMVAEGVKSTEAVLALAAEHQVDMPIAAMVGAVLYDDRRPADLVPSLMLREAKAELHGFR